MERKRSGLSFMAARAFYLCPELNSIHMAAHTLNHSDLLKRLA